MNSQHGTVVAVCISSGGIPRTPVESIQLAPSGILEDGHRFPEHYDPARAVTLFDESSLHTLDHSGTEFLPGSVGENITTRGIDFAALESGTLLQMGPTVLRLERRWTPCHGYVDGKQVPNRQARRGFFASVVAGGRVSAGCEIRIGERGETVEVSPKEKGPDE